MPSDEQELRDKAQLADRMIEQIELGMENLRRKILEVTTAPPPHVLSPFNRLERNAISPLRNKYALRIAALEEKLADVSMRRDSFFYMIAGPERAKSSVASFRPTDRTLFINDDFSAESLMDGIVTVHEAVHIMQDDNARLRIETMEDAYEYLEKYRFLSERKRILVEAEVPAYHRELLIANLALDGDLAQPQGIAEEEAASRLGVHREEQRHSLRVILHLANRFPGFADHQHEQPFPHNFVLEVIQMYNYQKYQICTKDPTSGRLITLN